MGITAPESAPQEPAARTETIAAAPLANDFPNSSEEEPAANAKPFIGPLPNPNVFLTGNLTEKVRSQGWSKRHEYRILVTLERDPFSGLPVADRYYCCSMYMDEAQASALKLGQPVRIKIEQD